MLVNGAIGGIRHQKAPNGPKAIIWTNDDRHHLCKYVNRLHNVLQQQQQQNLPYSKAFWIDILLYIYTDIAHLKRSLENR